MPAPAPRAVIFDLGKVLLDFDYAIAARTLSPLSRLEPVAFRHVLDQSPLLHEFESGRLTNEQFHAEVQSLTGYGGSFAQFAAAFGDIFAEIPPMIALHQKLRARGVPTWIFSNTNELAVGHIRRQFPFFNEFDGYVLSHEIRAMKPLPASYEAVEQRAGQRGRELLYLDDRAENIAGAAARGWQTILHADPGASVRQVEAAFGF